MLNRRNFAIGAALTAGSALVLLRGNSTKEPPGTPANTEPDIQDPKIFITIDPDNRITLMAQHLEMGQGILTGLATIVANELGASWSQIQVRHAPADRTRFKKHATSASSSLAKSWEPLRQVAAAARKMLTDAAADHWQVDARSIRLADGYLSVDGTDLRSSFGDFALAASQLPTPRLEEIELKDRSAWTLIGKDLPRVDGDDKVTGRTVFGMDLRRPEMVRAVIARPPRFGAQLQSFDDAAAMAVSGVLEVVALPNAVAVLAENTWSAMKGRDALIVSWNDDNAEKRSSETMFEDFASLARKPGVPARRDGNAEEALAEAARTIDFEYRLPYLAHAAMEPLNAVIELTPGGARVWAGSQFPPWDQEIVAEILGLEDPAKVEFEVAYCGSSFGRRADSLGRWIQDLAHTARASQLGRPIHMVWTREDDMRGGNYRPMAVHYGQAGLDENGNITGWRHYAACQSIVEGTPWTAFLESRGFDRAAVGGLTETRYDIPNFWVDWCRPTSPVPVAFWRSVGDSQTGFVMESVLDELAHLADTDPLEFRLDLLRNAPRQRRVLEAAARLAEWGTKTEAPHAQGIATTFDDILNDWPATFIAMVADVTVDEAGIKVDRICAAVDCGTVINPDIVRTQIEGSVAFALGPVFRNAITLKDGYVQESNFHTFEPTRMREMPEILVEIIDSELAPSGVGEVGVAPVAPAIANAVFAATGVRHRQLPIDVSWQT